jgi:hypothetical protein
MTFPIVGPVAPQTNPLSTPQYYAPWKFKITAITFGRTTLVTLDIPATTSLNYSVGQQVRFVIPPLNGCRQLNGVSAYVLSIPAVDQVELNIDTVGGDPFVVSSSNQYPWLLPAGDINNGTSNTSRDSISLTVPGAFINIS